MAGQLDLFLGLSASLTGYSKTHLEGTGVARAYEHTMRERIGEELLRELLGTWEGIRDIDDPHELADALRHEILSSPDLGGPARNLIKMWYLGQWDIEPPYNYEIVSGQAYVEGLVWDAIGAHPMGAKQPGFGTWAFPPGSLNEAPVSIEGARS